MIDRYNLWDERWIDVCRLTQKESYESMGMGITDLLLKAHKVADVEEPNPLFKFGLYRFLVALVMDAFDLNSVESLTELLALGHFPEEVVGRYYEEWGHKFYLFSDDEPFYQNVAIADLSKTKPISYLIPQFPTGSNPALHLDLFDDEHAICPEVCARALISYPPFAIGLGISHKKADGRWIYYTSGLDKTPAYYFLVKGNTVFETIVLNCYPSTIESNSGGGLVAWKQEKVDCDARIEELSLLQAFTWLPRQVYLLPEFKEGICTYSGNHSDILISQMRFLQGQKLTKKCTWTDPNVAYFKKSQRSKAKPLKPMITRPLWRLIPQIILPRDDNISFIDNELFEKINLRSRIYSTPLVVDQFRELQKCGAYPVEDVSVEVFGLVVDKGRAAKLLEQLHETYTLPSNDRKARSRFLLHTSSVITIIESILAQVISYSFRPYRRCILDTFLRRAGLQYRQLLHDHLLPNDLYQPESSSLLSDWISQIITMGLDALHEVSERVGATLPIMKDAITMERRFYGLINTIFSSDSNIINEKITKKDGNNNEN